MVDHLMPFISPLKFLVLRIGWNSATVVPNLHVPILFIMGDRDELVPSSHSLELYNLSKNAKLHTVRGGVSCRLLLPLIIMPLKSFLHDLSNPNLLFLSFILLIDPPLLDP